jgi:hypothetical protein
MASYGNKATFVEGKANPKRTAAKKKRGFGMGKIGLGSEKSIIDIWAQSKDPLFKIKGKERHRRLKYMF